MKKPLVTIIIPVYNSASYIQHAIRELLMQTYLPLELIAINDGSTDDSLTILQSIQAPNLIVIDSVNQGAAMARNLGLAKANGELIQFFDADDFMSFNKIEEQVKALQVHPGKIAVCNYKQFTTEEELKNDIYPDQSSFIYSSDDPQDFLINLWGGRGNMNFIQTNCWLVPKKIIEKAGNWRAYRCPDDDGEFFARVLLASEGIVYVPGVYTYYHIATGGINQLSRSKNKKYLQNTLLTIDLKYQYLLQKGVHPLLKKAIASQYLRFAVDLYPLQKKLSAIANRRYRKLNEQVRVPVLGGKLIEFLKHVFGWRCARLLRYYLRER